MSSDPSAAASPIPVPLPDSSVSSSAAAAAAEGDYEDESEVFPFGDDEEALNLVTSTNHNSTVAPYRLYRAEAILAHRTSRIILVLEHLVDGLNHQAILRSAEAFGIQNVWCIDTGIRKSYKVKGGKEFVPTSTINAGANTWLTIRIFKSTADCVAALKEAGIPIWVTNLGEGARHLTKESFPTLPPKVAVVMGREVDGVSKEMIEAADQQVFLPMYGFTESFNVSVATALVLQRLFEICPDCRGDLSESEKSALRLRWYKKLAPQKTNEDVFLRWIPKVDEIKWEERHLRPQEEVRIPRISKRVRNKIVEKSGREIAGMERVDITTARIGKSKLQIGKSQGQMQNSEQQAEQSSEANDDSAAELEASE